MNYDERKLDICKQDVIDAAIALEKWWVEEGKHIVGGAPVSMFMMRAALDRYRKIADAVGRKI